MKPKLCRPISLEVSVEDKAFPSAVGGSAGLVGTRTLDVLTPTLSAEPPAARFSFLGRGKIFLPLGKFSFLGRENPSFFDSVAKRVLAGSLSILAVVVFFP